VENLPWDRYPPYYWTEAVQRKLREQRAQNLAKTETLFEEKAAELRLREELGEIIVRAPVVDIERNRWHCNSCGNEWKRKTLPVDEYGFPEKTEPQMSKVPERRRGLFVRHKKALVYGLLTGIFLVFLEAFALGNSGIVAWDVTVGWFAVTLSLPWLAERFLSRRLLWSVKRRVYRPFLWTISNALGHLDDFRTLQRLRVADLVRYNGEISWAICGYDLGYDEEIAWARAGYDEEVDWGVAKLISLSSKYSPRLMSVLEIRSLIEERERIPKNAQVQGLAGWRTLLFSKVQIAVLRDFEEISDYAKWCAQNIGMFAPASLEASLSKVIGSASSYSMWAGGVESWSRKWNAALKELRHELNKYLRSHNTQGDEVLLSISDRPAQRAPIH